jgi:hypothetical protein
LLLLLLLLLCVQADVKSQLLLSPASHYRGYQPLGLNVTRHEAGFTPDWHEALDLFREEEPAAVKVSGCSAGAATVFSLHHVLPSATQWSAPYKRIVPVAHHKPYCSAATRCASSA